MKFLILIFMMALLASCNQENIASYDDLDPDEQAALRQLAADRCKKDTEKNYSDYAARSNAEINRLDRGDVYKLNFKSGSTTSTTSMYLWKRTASASYFMYRYMDGLTERYDFIKVTDTINSLMVADLREKKCDVNSVTPQISNANDSLTLKYLKVKSTLNSIDYETDTTYTGTRLQPMFFAAYAASEVKRTYNTTGAVTATTTASYTFADVVNQDDDLEDSYTLYPANRTRYCIMDYTLGAVPATDPVTFNFPYTPMTCATDPTQNVNNRVNARAEFNFTPSAEL